MKLVSDIKRTGLRTLDSLGLGEVAAETYDEITGRTNFDIDPNIREYNGESSRGVVFLFMIQGQGTIRHCILAHAYRCRGFRPIIILCDGMLNLCHRKSPDWNDNSVCHSCKNYGREMIQQFGLESIEISSVFKSNDELKNIADRNIKHEEVSLQRFAKASTRKYLRRYNLNLDDPESHHTIVYQRFLRSASILTETTERLIEQYNPTVVLAHDDRYIYGGIPLAIAQSRNIPAYSHGYGYRDQMLICGKVTDQSSLPQYTDPKFVSDILEIPLSDDETSEIDEIMYGRRSGNSTRIHYTKKANQSIDVPSDIPLVGMFTNLIWDASLEPKKAPFPDVFNWIETTISTFYDRDDIHLFIKTHPAEAIRGTNERVDTWIEKQFDDIPENITILSPDSEIDTYSLIDALDAGIVYNSTVGLEMAYRGYPVVVGGDTHYRGFNITFDPDTQSEYIELTNKISELDMSVNRQNRAVRYSHMLFARKHIPFEFYETVEGDVKYESVSHNDIIDNSALDLIVEKTVRGKLVIRN